MDRQLQVLASAGEKLSALQQASLVHLRASRHAVQSIPECSFARLEDWLEQAATG